MSDKTADQLAIGDIVFWPGTDYEAKVIDTMIYEDSGMVVVTAAVYIVPGAPRQRRQTFDCIDSFSLLRSAYDEAKAKERYVAVMGSEEDVRAQNRAEGAPNVDNPARYDPPTYEGL